MKYRVIILPVAKADINAAAKWIRQNDSQQKAKVWVNEINDAVASLNTFTARCALAAIDDAFEEEIRQLLYRKGKEVYRIVFTI
ncbi:type II toxin-antitoxin system RelE/ParE family toxin [Nostoc sp.]|uniref:type II toxin-antitoxin system RelE/ParE family toxin n=1 Tax=Nostoc sp. TaxID=1180 RepID=UPI002FFD4FB2